ncbi:hypothetical protein ACJX0J_018263, partial [Zea mays]
RIDFFIIKKDGKQPCITINTKNWTWMHSNRLKSTVANRTTKKRRLPGHTIGVDTQILSPPPPPPVSSNVLPNTLPNLNYLSPVLTVHKSALHLGPVLQVMFGTSRQDIKNLSIIDRDNKINFKDLDTKV